MRTLTRRPLPSPTPLVAPEKQKVMQLTIIELTLAQMVGSKELEKAWSENGHEVVRLHHQRRSISTGRGGPSLANLNRPPRMTQGGNWTHALTNMEKEGLPA